MAATLTEDEIIAVYNTLLGRNPEPGATEGWLKSGADLRRMLETSLKSPEFLDKIAADSGKATANYSDDLEYKSHTGLFYSSPRELRRTETEIDRVLLVGQCLLDEWPRYINEMGFRVSIDRLLLTLDKKLRLPRSANRYTFQISSIPLRQLLDDPDYFKLIRTGFKDTAQAQETFDLALRKLELFLNAATLWRDHFPIYVANLPSPQHNIGGRYLRRYELADGIYFVNELNRNLYTMISDLENVYLLDVDNMLSVHGRRTFQDDSVHNSNHGSALKSHFFHEDQKRLIKTRRCTEYYSIDEKTFAGAVWLEAESMYRTLKQVDSVKMVCVDLDDTLWRGVLAENDEIDDQVAKEGWPLGVVEALLTLKSRGILLVLLSKNTEKRVREIFDKVFCSEEIRLDDFAIIKINWASKVENMRQAMEEANLLPRSVVFLDDNPVEREAVKAAFPDVRVIEAPHYYWKRILLWSPETQVVSVTDESARRTEMVRAQVVRERTRESLSREEFLAGLNVSARLLPIEVNGRGFDRAFELLNKTNQFNTTGKRWSRQEFERACADGLVVGCQVSDRLTDYGLVLVAIILGNRVEQVVMSCRVISLEVEISTMVTIAGRVLQKYPDITGIIQETDANILSRDLFERLGWRLMGGLWTTTEKGAPSQFVNVIDELSLAES